MDTRGMDVSMPGNKALLLSVLSGTAGFVALPKELRCFCLTQSTAQGASTIDPIYFSFRDPFLVSEAMTTGWGHGVYGFWITQASQ